MGWFGKSKYLKYGEKLPDIEKHVGYEQKRCTNCNRLLSEYTEKELCYSCDVKSTS